MFAAPSSARPFPRHRLVLATLVALLIGGAASADEPQAAVSFTSLDKAIAHGAQKQQVIVVMFTARWCVWCQRMKTSTFTDPKVVELSSQFAWALVDTDVQPRIAAMAGVRGLPTLMWLNARGELLATHSGYLSAEAMEKKLRELADQADQPGQTRKLLQTVDQAVRQVKLADSDLKRVEAVRQLVEAAAQRDRMGREPARQALADGGSPLWMALTVCLEDERLALRAAANDLLAEATGREGQFDPFADADTRARQIAAWRQWIAEHRTAPPRDADPDAPDAPEPPDAEPAPAQPMDAPPDIDPPPGPQQT